MRELTHTLHLPPAQSEIYDRPHLKWLRDVLKQLPHLQNLRVSRFPFFDHSALRPYDDIMQLSAPDILPTFALRLLIAEQCPNTTSSGLAQFLVHFPNLVYLNLSNTSPARDKSVLSSLKHLPNLQVLKLRQVNLRDEDIDTLAAAVGIRVRSLDVRHNLLTDKSVETLLRSCFIAPGVNDGLGANREGVLLTAGLEDWPAGIARPAPHLLADFRDEALDEHFTKRLATATIGRLPSEDLPLSGITHLYIAENRLSTAGLAKLIESGRLFVLDAGSIKDVSRTDLLTTSPGIEKLVPVIEKHCSANLTSLRIHHAVITTKLSAKDIGLAPPVSFELSAEEKRFELSTSPPVFELGTEAITPIYELPGNPLHLVVTRASGEETLEAHQILPSPGTVAPEAVEEVCFKTEEASIITSAGLGLMAQAVNGTGGDDVTSLDHANTTELSLSLIREQRQQLRSRQDDKPYALLPGNVPKLKTLTLTDVPSHDPGDHIAKALIQFITDCATEAKLAALETDLLEPHKPHKPNSQRWTSNSKDPHKIFALSRIVLEMFQPTSSSSKPSSPRRQFQFRSITGEPDCETLTTAAQNDFSFTTNEADEECGQLAIDPGLPPALPILTEKMPVLSTTDDDSGPDAISSQSSSGYHRSLSFSRRPQSLQLDPGKHVRQELINFRTRRKMEYEDARRRGADSGAVSGYWPGEVKIVRI